MSTTMRILSPQIDGRWDQTEISPATVHALASQALLFPFNRGRSLALLSRGGVRLNGLEALPVEILEPQDEIRVAGQVWFVAASQAAPAPFEGPAGTRCARCHNELLTGETVTTCTSCGAAHHSPECWSAAPVCGSCAAQTSNDAWRPEPFWRDEED